MLFVSIFYSDSAFLRSLRSCTAQLPQLQLSDAPQDPRKQRIMDCGDAEEGNGERRAGALLGNGRQTRCQ